MEIELYEGVHCYWKKEKKCWKHWRALGTDWASHLVMCVGKCVYLCSTHILHALLRRSGARNINIGFYANECGGARQRQTKGSKSSTKTQKIQSDRIIKGNCRRKKRRILVECLNILVVDWCSLPQNNVSMFFKWIFVRLLKRVPIKLYPLQCYRFVCVSNVLATKKHIMLNVKYIT